MVRICYMAGHWHDSAQLGARAAKWPVRLAGIIWFPKQNSALTNYILLQAFTARELQVQSNRHILAKRWMRFESHTSYNTFYWISKFICNLFLVFGAHWNQKYTHSKFIVYMRCVPGTASWKCKVNSTKKEKKKTKNIVAYQSGIDLWPSVPCNSPYGVYAYRIPNAQNPEALYMQNPHTWANVFCFIVSTFDAIWYHSFYFFVPCFSASIRM